MIRSSSFDIHDPDTEIERTLRRSQKNTAAEAFRQSVTEAEPLDIEVVIDGAICTRLFPFSLRGRLKIGFNH